MYHPLVWIESNTSKEMFNVEKTVSEIIDHLGKSNGTKSLTDAGQGWRMGGWGESGVSNYQKKSDNPSFESNLMNIFEIFELFLKFSIF